MSLPRSTNRPSKPALQTTSFTLPGRRTLSEHLPAEIIHVPLTLVQRSSYLRQVIAQQALKDPRQRQFNLPNIDSMGFRMYMEWLRTGNVEFHALMHESSRKGLLLRDCFDLFFAHMAGSQLEEPDFQDYILDTMARVLDASQTPDLKVLEVVFLEKGASNVLKQFVVDRMFAVERKMLGMMRGLVGDVECTEGGGNRCEYHVHQEGDCYRNRSKRACADVIRSANADLHHEINTTHDSQQSSSSPSSPLTPYTEETIPSMTNAPYLRPATCSRDSSLDKPLPSIPPPPPDPSPNPRPSPQQSKPPRMIPTHPAPEAPSTQHLIAKTPSPLPSTKPLPAHHPPAPNPTATQSLIRECLERYKKSSSPHSPLALPAPMASEKSVESQAPISTSKGDIARDKDAAGAGLLSPLRGGTEDGGGQVLGTGVGDDGLGLHGRDGQCVSGRRGLVQNVCCLPSVGGVRRRAVPPRGADWLRQYDCVNSMHGAGLVVMAKRSKKSRFKEVLRSESRAGLEG